MKIDKKKLFEYLDKWTFTTKSELETEINYFICDTVGARYYTPRLQTPRLRREYTKTRLLNLKK
jgi:hypothetical protein